MNSADNTTRLRRRGAGIAIVILLFTTLATVGVIRWMRHSPGASPGAPVAQSPTAAANWSRANFTANVDAGVRRTSDHSWSVKGGRAFMNVRRKDDESLELRF